MCLAGLPSTLEFGTGFLSEASVHHLDRMTDQRALPSSSPGVRMYFHHAHSLYVGARDLNSGPHTREAGTYRLSHLPSLSVSLLHQARKVAH